MSADSFYYGFSQLSTSEFLKREMEMHETKNHLLCGWWAGAYSTITFPRYNRGVQATTTERKGD